MRLAATLTPMRDAARQAVALRGTLRDPALAPHEVTILDLSTSGFLAELPAGLELEPGTRVRVAATPLGAHEAIAVRRDDGFYGFAFTRSLDSDALVASEGAQASSVAAFPLIESLPVPDDAMPSAEGADDAAPAISARASLLLVTGVSLGLWGLLAAALWFASPLG